MLLLLMVVKHGLCALIDMILLIIAIILYLWLMTNMEKVVQKLGTTAGLDWVKSKS